MTVFASLTIDRFLKLFSIPSSDIVKIHIHNGCCTLSSTFSRSMRFLKEASIGYFDLLNDTANYRICVFADEIDAFTTQLLYSIDNSALCNEYDRVVISIPNDESYVEFKVLSELVTIGISLKAVDHLDDMDSKYISCKPQWSFKVTIYLN